MEYLNEQGTAERMMELLNEERTAQILGVSRFKLQADRHYRRGLAYIRIGRRILYKREDIEAFINEHRIDPEAR